MLLECGRVGSNESRRFRQSPVLVHGREPSTERVVDISPRICIVIRRTVRSFRSQYGIERRSFRVELFVLPVHIEGSSVVIHKSYCKFLAVLGDKRHGAGHAILAVQIRRPPRKHIFHVRFFIEIRILTAVRNIREQCSVLVISNPVKSAFIRIFEFDFIIANRAVKFRDISRVFGCPAMKTGRPSVKRIRVFRRRFLSRVLHLNPFTGFVLPRLNRISVIVEEGDGVYDRPRAGKLRLIILLSRNRLKAFYRVSRFIIRNPLVKRVFGTIGIRFLCQRAVVFGHNTVLQILIVPIAINAELNLVCPNLLIKLRRIHGIPGHAGNLRAPTGKLVVHAFRIHPIRKLPLAC